MPDPAPDPKDLNRLLLAAFIGLVLLLGWNLLFAQELPAGTTLDARQAVETSQRAIGRGVGDYTLTASDGREIRLSQFRGKPLVVSFIYTGCFQVCPTTTKFLAEAVDKGRKAVGDDAFHVLTIGFNLPFDSPMAMREFARKQGIGDPRWTFATPSPDTLNTMAAEFGFQWVPTPAGFDHLTQATIVDRDGRIVRQVYGDSFELPMFVAPLRELVLGEPAPRYDFASWVERVRVLCTVYDPRAGRYRLNYGLFIEIFTGSTIVVATVWYLIANSRRRRPPTGTA
ncbi:MAG: SCO family protein [Burkholderiales bacterium]|nr:SCO family protein [Burkholderiales bacterium]